jgi:hypothetical protein
MKRTTVPGWITIALVLPVLLLYSRPAGAQDGLKPEITGYLKELGQLAFDNDLGTLRYDNIIHHRIESEWTFSEQWEFRADLRTRLLNGYSVLNAPGLADYYGSDPNFLDLSWVWLDTDHTLMHSTIDRLHVSYFRGPWEVHLGRQRINWAKTLVWSPNDLFNNYAFLDFDYEERPGVDALSARYNWSYASSVEASIRFADAFNEMTIAAMLRTTWRSYDLQVIAGHYLEHMALGGGWAGYIGGAGFRGEVTYFHPEDRFFGDAGHVTAAAGFDYMFSNSLYAQGELLYNGGYREAGNPLTELIRPPTATDLFPARTGMFLNGTYPLHPLVNVSLGFMNSFDRSIYIIIPQVTISLTENTDLLILSQLLKGSVFNNALETPNLLFFRLKWSY